MRSIGSATATLSCSTDCPGDGVHRAEDVDELVEDDGFTIRLIAGANPQLPHDVELWLDKRTFPLGLSGASRALERLTGGGASLRAPCASVALERSYQHVFQDLLVARRPSC